MSAAWSRRRTFWSLISSSAALWAAIIALCTATAHAGPIPPYPPANLPLTGNECTVGLQGGQTVQLCVNEFGQYAQALQITTAQIATTSFASNVPGFTTSGYAAAGDAGGAVWERGGNCQTVHAVTGTVSQQTITATSSISGTTLTGSGYVIGGYLTGTGVIFGTQITGGSGSSWTVSISQSVGSTAITETYTQLSTSPLLDNSSIGEAVTGAGLPGGLILTQIISGDTFVLSGNYGAAGPEAMTVAPLGAQASLDGQCWSLSPAQQFNPNMFGARANNVADDTAAINNAIAYLDQAFNGGTLYLLPFEYKTTQPLYFRSSIRLLGAAARGDVQPGNGLSSTIAYTGNDAAIHAYQTIPIWYAEIGNLSITAPNETNEVIDASAWNFSYIHHSNFFGSGTGVTKGILLGSAANNNNASYDEIENNYIGLVTLGINISGIATSDFIYANRIQPIVSGDCFFLANSGTQFPDNLTLTANQCETGNASVVGLAIVTGTGIVASGNRFELPGSGSTGISVTGSGSDTSGAISAANGALTAGTVTGTLTTSQQITGAGVTQPCFVSTNISGSGSGSTWNVSGCSAVSSEALVYNGPMQCFLLGNYFSGVTTNLKDPSNQCAGSDPTLPPSGGVATLLYSTPEKPDRLLAPVQEITATDGTGFTINAPLHPFLGAMLTITIRNNSGTSLGTITWNAIYKMGTFTAPANGLQTSIRFYYSPLGNWVETDQGLATVPIG